MEKITKSKERPCPYCGRPSRPDSFPFCSDRCRLIDLSGWLSEVYTIPAEELDDEDREILQ
ncbi:MAG: DNA gyrase inhibitor YacG [Deltaproteobacteria bacterium]|nr:DNA gyrase inhibitor YacG [Candidatus Zymogenaceae bacterium]